MNTKPITPNLTRFDIEEQDLKDGLEETIRRGLDDHAAFKKQYQQLLKKQADMRHVVLRFGRQVGEGRGVGGSEILDFMII